MTTTRREFLTTFTGAGAAMLLGCSGSAETRNDSKESTMSALKPIEESGARPADRMPVIFVGHGSPMNVIENNEWSRGFVALSAFARRPVAIVAISAHWYVSGTYVTSNAHPRTIHDFSGFPQALYSIEYRAPGKVDLAKRVRALLGEDRVALNADWGLDHGTWSVLKWMYPDADIPVIQLSIHSGLAASQHVSLARSLLPLRDDGVLIVASGNIVHNLRDAMQRMRTGAKDIPPWAQRFDTMVKEALGQRDTAALVKAWPDTDDGRLAHPSPDHWLPLLYAYAATDDRDKVQFPTEGFDLGSISMRNVVFGGAAT